MSRRRQQSEWREVAPIALIAGVVMLGAWVGSAIAGSWNDFYTDLIMAAGMLVTATFCICMLIMADGFRESRRGSSGYHRRTSRMLDEAKAAELQSRALERMAKLGGSYALPSPQNSTSLPTIEPQAGPIEVWEPGSGVWVDVP